MKISVVSSLLLGFFVGAAADPTNLRLLTTNTCNGAEKVKDYGSSSTGLSVAQTSSDGGFTAPVTGDFVCTLNCNSGSNLNLYVKYGTSGSAGPNNYDAEIVNGKCGSSVSALNKNNVTGIKLSFYTPNAYSNLVLDCKCQNTAGGKKKGCFSGETMVDVENQGLVAMEELQMGDSVLVGHGKYEPVYSFGHYELNTKHDFVQIYTNDAKPLEMTSDHFLFRQEGWRNRPVTAGDIQVGDVLASGSKVTKISSTNKKGMYMPLTPSGKIVVNGEQASTYVSLLEYAPGIVQHPALKWWLSDNFLFHAWLSPYRMACMGISSTFCENKPEEGIMNWLLLGWDVMQFIEALPLAAQVVMGFTVLPTLGLFIGVEMLLGPVLTPVALLVAAYGLYMTRKRTAQEGSSAVGKKVL